MRRKIGADIVRGDLVQDGGKLRQMRLPPHAAPLRSACHVTVVDVLGF